MLILASRSPQRRAILEQLGVAFEVRAADVPEIEAGDPWAAAAENARRKAEAVARPGETVLGADTVVTLDGRILPKPADAAQAREWLRALSGRTHEVLGGLALAGGEGLVERTAVTFRELDEPLIDWYVASGEWRGRAGGYAIQGRGAALVASIEGDYFNVVGLPVQGLLQLVPDVLSSAP